MRRVLVLGFAVLLATTLAGASGAASAAPRHVTVKIEGGNFMVPNRSLTTTYHFPDPIKIAQNGTITFVNVTDDAHTITMVAAADLPTTVRQTFDCGICNRVNGIYGLNGNGPPSIGQIDAGHASDDTNADADAADPGVPPGLPFHGLIEDFDTAAHSNRGAPPTVGDSTIVGPNTSPVTQRTIQVTAAPGTYHYFCTLHAWMQGTIVVTP